MSWNNDKLNEIQQIEYNLINSKVGSKSIIFTSFIHNTDEWIDSKNEKEVLDFKEVEKFVMPQQRKYKYHFIEPTCMKEITDDIAKYITQGNNLNVSCILAGYNYNVLRTRFKPEHLAKFKRARELKFNINK